jgi:hypothetical protein
MSLAKPPPLGGLTFFPALALGPITEHLAVAKGCAYAAP